MIDVGRCVYYHSLLPPSLRYELILRLSEAHNTLGSVGKLRRRPESEQFFRLAKTAKQAMFVLSSIQPDAGRRKKGRSKPDRILRQAPRQQRVSVRMENNYESFN